MVDYGYRYSRSVSGKKNGKWEYIDSEYEGSRHYFLFAWLAGVRNGFGVAGNRNHTEITPISEPRGLPDDIQADGKYVDDGRFSEHSYSWLTADEILEANPPDRVWETGVVTLSELEKWDGYSMPYSYSRGISGPGILVADSPVHIKSDTTHVRITWRKPGGGFNYFVDEIRRLKAEYGEVRMVFGFD